MLPLLRWLFRNLGALLLALALSVVVWITAISESDPVVERVRTAPLEVVGQAPNMLLVESIPATARVTLRAPRTIAERMAASDNAMHAWIDLTGLGAGQHEVNVEVDVNEAFEPVRKVQTVPERITVTLESLETRAFPIHLEVSGSPAIGYQKGALVHNPSSVTVSGAASLVSQVEEVHASLDISDAIETIVTEIPLQALDSRGNPVNGVSIIPNEVRVEQPISLQGGYRNVVVKVATTGQVANGYRLTNILVSPPNVVVFSSDPQLVNELPSYVETMPIVLTDAEDDIDSFVALNLPEGISVVGDQSVLVQVSIAAIDGSLTLSLPVVPIGLLPTLAGDVSPDAVDVILSGPVPVLNRMRPTDIRVVVDLRDLELGTYVLQPEVDVLPERVRVETILPSTVEVNVTVAPTTTPTGTYAPSPQSTAQP